MSKTEVEMTLPPPDGGWGWVVIGAAFISIGFSYALPKTITVFFKEIQLVFNTSYSDIAWISSIMLAVMYAGGPISSILVNNFGSRPVVIAGGLLCCIGFICASFSASVLHLYITVGLIGGIGLSFNLQPALAIIGRYFYKKRPLANGIAMAGSPVFLSTLAPFSQYLLNDYGWKGSFMILGGLLLNSCVAGSLMRPLGNREIPSNDKSVGGMKTKEVNMKSRHSKTSISESVNNCLDLSLFKHRGFLIYLSGNVILFLGFFSPVLFLTLYAKDKGIDEYSAAFLLSVFAFVDMFARPSAGFIANTKYIRPRIQYFFSFAIMFTGVCHLLFPLAQNYTSMIVYAVFFGLGFGTVSSILFEALIDLVGATRYSSAVGLVTIVECCPVLLGPPLAGKMVDYTRSYKYTYIACGVIILLGSVWLLIGHTINYRLLKKENKLKPSKKKIRSREAKLSEPLKPAKNKNATIISSERETNI